MVPLCSFALRMAPARDGQSPGLPKRRVMSHESHLTSINLLDRTRIVAENVHEVKQSSSGCLDINAQFSRARQPRANRKLIQKLPGAPVVTLPAPYERTAQPSNLRRRRKRRASRFL